MYSMCYQWYIPRKVSRYNYIELLILIVNSDEKMSIILCPGNLEMYGDSRNVFYMRPLNYIILG